MSQFRRGLNKNANNPQFRRSVKATSWKARNKTKRKQKAHQIARENYDLYEADEGRSRGAHSRVPRLLRLLVYSFFFLLPHSALFMRQIYELRHGMMTLLPLPLSLFPPSDLFTCSCSSFRCLGTFYGPAPAVSCSASASASVLLDRANKLGISQLIYIKPNASAFSSLFPRQKSNCQASPKVGDDSATPTIIWLNLTQ